MVNIAIVVPNATKANTKPRQQHAVRILARMILSVRVGTIEANGAAISMVCFGVCNPGCTTGDTVSPRF